MKTLQEKCFDWLEHLCVRIPDRSVGSPGNRKATNFFMKEMESMGLHTSSQEFDCIDWESEGASIVHKGRKYEVNPSPYGLGGTLEGSLLVVSSLEELRHKDMRGRILLLHGEIAREQLMPKNFHFYNPEHHRETISLMEQGQPAGIIAVTGKNPELAGAVYPFPLIEDGDFDIPSVYMKDKDAHELIASEGDMVTLEIKSRRIDSRAENIIVRTNPEKKKNIVVCAHIDSKKGTPGALDNASGVVVLLALASLLSQSDQNLAVEIVALNGEDYYGIPGQLAYFEDIAARKEYIILGINIDGAGFKGKSSSLSTYECSPALYQKVKKAAETHGIGEGDAWPQGDHSIFIYNGIAAAAFTSENLDEILQDLAHTPKDTIEQVDAVQLGNIARCIHGIILEVL